MQASRIINIDKWERKEIFNYFHSFEEPFFGATVNIDCTKAYTHSKTKKCSFFLYYLYRALKAANEIENFRYRIIDKNVHLFDKIDSGPTIARENGSFGFALILYYEDENKFIRAAKKEIVRVQKSDKLISNEVKNNIIHFSTIPWLDFTSLSHARKFTREDSSPKITFGKLTTENGKKTMPVSIHVHHSLADGYHVGIFADKFQKLLDDNTI